MNVIWSDEFRKDGPPDPEKWTLQTGGHGFGNGELQFYTDRAGSGANAAVKDEKLRITLRKEAFQGNGYTSARMFSKASWQYGRIDVSAKLPRGAGTWPAIWMLGENRKEVGWPQCGEIDIMEHVGRTQDVIHVSLHTGLYNHKIKKHLTQVSARPGVSEAFHLYSIDWRKDEIAFLFDGEEVTRWVKGQDGRDTGTGGWPFNQPFFMILNLAYGGGFGGVPDDACLPQTFEIEYVRVYQ
ncbi:MAG: glycoside hydrolase family 16 protein [Oscillospiraceae bacterium]|jgi:beta-glucanase (GH16 family)|nr:glycoside hydrolase family 16 protein [Oscillospiraceae bacterium]